MTDDRIQGGFFSKLDSKSENKTRRYYFMAGLPRSGSTVLSSILNQNPKLYSGPSSPILPLMYTVENQLMNDELYHGYPKPIQANQIISNLINQFYGDVDNEIVIDKNRAWPARIPYIEGYIKQQAKIICPVRDIDEILTSMIMLIRRNPYKEGNPRINFIDEQLIKLNISLNDDNRCEYIAGPDGILGQSLTAIMEAFNQGFGDRIHFVEYKDLLKNPQRTLEKIYDFLGEDKYEHDFNKLENQNREEDMNTYGLEDMHEVRPVLNNTAPKPTDILSSYVLNKCNGMDFWRSTPYIQKLPKYMENTQNKFKIIK